MRTQPHIHDTVITVRRGRRLHHFHIFVKNHRLLPLNAAIATLAPGHQWRGDILVMRAGTSVAGVVNIRNGDRRLIDYAVRWYLSPISYIHWAYILHSFVQRVHQGSRLYFPRNLIF